MQPIDTGNLAWWIGVTAVRRRDLAGRKLAVEWAKDLHGLLRHVQAPVRMA
jgi:hypothetical protein